MNERAQREEHQLLIEQAKHAARTGDVAALNQVLDTPFVQRYVANDVLGTVFSFAVHFQQWAVFNAALARVTPCADGAVATIREAFRCGCLKQVVAMADCIESNNPAVPRVLQDCVAHGEEGYELFKALFLKDPTGQARDRLFLSSSLQYGVEKYDAFVMRMQAEHEHAMLTHVVATHVGADSKRKM